MKIFKQRGGGQIGGFYSTWPFASISVAPGQLTLRVLGRSITLAPEELLAVQPIGFIPILWHGVRIHHRQNTIPEYETFYSANRSALLDAIKAAGFHIGEPPDPWKKNGARHRS